MALQPVGKDKSCARDRQKHHCRDDVRADDEGRGPMCHAGHPIEPKEHTAVR
jgi:hypothetical protein